MKRIKEMGCVLFARGTKAYKSSVFAEVYPWGFISWVLFRFHDSGLMVIGFNALRCFLVICSPLLLFLSWTFLNARGHMG